MGLKDDVKVALRVTGDALDLEVDANVAAALQDLRRVGVPEAMLQEQTPDPLVRLAVILWCKAHFGYDNSESSRFLKSYVDMRASMLNSPSSYPCYRGGDSACDGPTPPFSFPAS